MPLLNKSLRNNWIAVASAEHARQGCALPEQGFMQVCHGKCAPLKRVQAGDRVAYYAPNTTMASKDRLQSFISIGLVQPSLPYAFDMGGGFMPFRRDVIYTPSKEAAIAPLLDHFEFIENRTHWGYKFRFGLFKVSDASCIALVDLFVSDSSDTQPLKIYSNY